MLAVQEVDFCVNFKSSLVQGLQILLLATSICLCLSSVYKAWLIELILNEIDALIIHEKVNGIVVDVQPVKHSSILHQVSWVWVFLGILNQSSPTVIICVLILTDASDSGCSTTQIILSWVLIHNKALKVIIVHDYRAEIVIELRNLALTLSIIVIHPLSQ